MLDVKNKKFEEYSYRCSLLTVCVHSIERALKKFGIRAFVDWGNFPEFGSECECVYIPIHSMLGINNGLDSLQKEIVAAYLADNEAKVCLVSFFNDKPIANISTNDSLERIISHFRYIIGYSRSDILYTISSFLRTGSIKKALKSVDLSK